MVALSHICVMVTVLFSPSANLSTTKSVSSCWFNSLVCVLNWHLEWHRIKAFWNLIEIQLNKASLCDESVWSVSSLCKLLTSIQIDSQSSRLIYWLCSTKSCRFQLAAAALLFIGSAHLYYSMRMKRMALLRAWFFKFSKFYLFILLHGRNTFEICI